MISSAFDNYPGFFDMLMAQEGKPPSSDGITTTISLGHDLARSVKGGEPFMIMEEQSGKAGQKAFAPQPETGQVRLWTYQAIAHGAMGINYFRWDTATFGAEEYWHGILNHDRSKSPAYEEIRQTVKELKALGQEVLYSQYAAQTALVYDYDCSWAVKIQPGHYALDYMAQVTSWYGAINASHTGIDVIAPEADLVPVQNCLRAAGLRDVRKASREDQELCARRRNVRDEFPAGRENREQPDRSHAASRVAS